MQLYRHLWAHRSEACALPLTAHQCCLARPQWPRKEHPTNLRYRFFSYCPQAVGAAERLRLLLLSHLKGPLAGHLHHPTAVSIIRLHHFDNSADLVASATLNYLPFHQRVHLP